MVAKGYRTPADLLIDRMGWGSPVVQRSDASPVYEPRMSVIMNNPQIKSPEVEQIRQMPTNIVSTIETPVETPTTTVDTIQSPTNIVE